MSFLSSIPEPDETNIPYSVAIKRTGKTERALFCTTVSWDDAPIDTVEVEFKTIGKVDIVKRPWLPRGYSLPDHPSWHEIFFKIYNKDACKNLSFEEMDDIVRDVFLLEEIAGMTIYWNWIYDDFPEYSRWCGSFDDRWAHLSNCIDSLYEQVLPPHKEPHSINEDGIGNRVDPPGLREMLVKMLEFFDSGQFVQPEEP